MDEYEKKRLEKQDIELRDLHIEKERDKHLSEILHEDYIHYFQPIYDYQPLFGLDLSILLDDVNDIYNESPGSSISEPIHIPEDTSFYDFVMTNYLRDIPFNDLNKMKQYLQKRYSEISQSQIQDSNYRNDDKEFLQTTQSEIEKYNNNNNNNDNGLFKYNLSKFGFRFGNTLNHFYSGRIDPIHSRFTFELLNDPEETKYGNRLVYKVSLLNSPTIARLKENYNYDDEDYNEDVVNTDIILDYQSKYSNTPLDESEKEMFESIHGDDEDNIDIKNKLLDIIDNTDRYKKHEDELIKLNLIEEPSKKRKRIIDESEENPKKIIKISDNYNTIGTIDDFDKKINQMPRKPKTYIIQKYNLYNTMVNKDIDKYPLDRIKRSEYLMKHFTKLHKDKNITSKEEEENSDYYDENEEENNDYYEKEEENNMKLTYMNDRNKVYNDIDPKALYFDRIKDKLVSGQEIIDGYEFGGEDNEIDIEEENDIQIVENLIKNPIVVVENPIVFENPIIIGNKNTIENIKIVENLINDDSEKVEDIHKEDEQVENLNKEDNTLEQVNGNENGNGNDNDEDQLEIDENLLKLTLDQLSLRYIFVHNKDLIEDDYKSKSDGIIFKFVNDALGQLLTNRNKDFIVTDKKIFYGFINHYIRPSSKFKYRKKLDKIITKVLPKMKSRSLEEIEGYTNLTYLYNKLYKT